MPPSAFRLVIRPTAPCHHPSIAIRTAIVAAQYTLAGQCRTYRPLSARYRQQQQALCPRRPHPQLVLVRSYAARPDEREPRGGTATPVPDPFDQPVSKSEFYFEAGYALFAKRKGRPFPPPFYSRPSSSFSDPLSTHNLSRDMRQWYHGEMIRGITNGDDAVLVSENMIAANDGVGAWAQKEKGHAALWSRLILHFWALEAEKDGYGFETEPDPRAYLQRAFDATKEATTNPNEVFGTTTTSGALIHSTGSGADAKAILYVTQLGDCQIMVIRPKDSEVVFKTKEQWHWFDCPRQLGTNSPDTPEKDAVVDKVTIEEGDVILATSDGVPDNLWEHEIVENVVESMRKAKMEDRKTKEDLAAGMQFVATELVKAAKIIATDPFAGSPFTERAIEEGLPTEGGKLDDISVVAALCCRRSAIDQRSQYERYEDENEAG